MERTLADKIGMLATVMNALAVSDKLEQLGVPTEVFTSITMPQVAQPFTRKDALRAMDEGKIAVFGGGTGNPFFSTDTATALRAVEVSADVMFKATMVDGVYDKDPHKYADAKKYDTLTFTKVLEDQLAVMDGCHSVPRQQAAHPRVRSGRPGQHCPCRAGRECGHTGLRGLKRLQPTYIIGQTHCSAAPR
jgi:uridylate kinase